jgi:hypothetical protein
MRANAESFTSLQGTRATRAPTDLRHNSYAYFYFERFFLEQGFRVQSADDGGSSTRASPVLSGGSKLSVARVLFQTALPRESCSTLPVRPL